MYQTKFRTHPHMYVPTAKIIGAQHLTYLCRAAWSCGAGCGDVRMRSEVKICVNAARFLPRRLPLFQPRPPQELHFTTRAQHLEDVQNMSGSAHTRNHSTNVGKHRPPFKRQLGSSEWGGGICLRRLNETVYKGCWCSTGVQKKKNVQTTSLRWMIMRVFTLQSYLDALLPILLSLV